VIFLNEGAGTFQAARDYGPWRGGAADSVTSADLNGDGRPDLVTSGGGACCTPIGVFLNRGDASFGPPRWYVSGGGIIPVTGGAPDSVEIADLNGDGKPDLVAVNVDAADLDGIGVSVLLNRGDGSFGSRRDYRVAGNLVRLAIGDVNGDGRPDLAAADNASNAVSLFLNKGHGRFQARRDYAAGDPSRDVAASDVAISDLNGDRRPDFLTTNYSSVSVLLNRPGLCNVQDVWGMKPVTARWRLARVNCRPVIRRVFDPRRDRPVGCGCGDQAAYWPKGGLVYAERPRFGAVLPAGGRVHLVVRFGRAR